MASRFVEADEEFIEELRNISENKNTKRSMDYLTNIFQQWAKTRGKNDQFESYNVPEPDEALNNFALYVINKGRLISPSLPVGDDRYLNLSSQKRPTGRNLGGNRLVRRSGTTSRVSSYQLCSRFRAKEMPTICVATGCRNQNDDAQGISLHVIPVFVGHRRQAKRRRKKWIDFVKQKRAISRREICGRAVAFLFNRMMETNSI
ncbi:hypothetical protein P5673_020691 [Acropora cervicornis]|uniref:THAP-type domain-containing protein n=1 Tax=Acropora cervicornis TaxID=6130 RepID=A0AAD9V128_ACRCE|nr:hypothetical protein P5673_020691 [Acropora cervicornis]